MITNRIFLTLFVALFALGYTTAGAQNVTSVGRDDLDGFSDRYHSRLIITQLDVLNLPARHRKS